MKDEVFSKPFDGEEDPWSIKKQIDSSKNIFIWKNKEEKKFWISWCDEELVPYKTEEGDFWLKPKNGLTFKVRQTLIQFNETKNQYEYFHTLNNYINDQFGIDYKGDYIDGNIDSDGNYTRETLSHLKRYVYKYTSPDGVIHEPARFFFEDITENPYGDTIKINNIDVKSQEMYDITRGLLTFDPEDTPYKEGDTIVIIANNGMPFLAKIRKIPLADSLDKYKFIAFPYNFDEYQEANRNLNEMQTLSTMLDFMPIASDAKDVYELITGTDLITGEELSRLVLAGTIILPGIMDTGTKKLAKNRVTQGNELTEKFVKEVFENNDKEVTNLLLDYLKSDAEKVATIVVKTESVENSIRCYTKTGSYVDIPNSQLTKAQKIFLKYGIESITRRSVRKSNSILDNTIMNKIKEIRDRFKAKPLRNKGNIAYAITDIDILTKKEYYAHSSIQEINNELLERVPDISIKPQKVEFETLKINREQIIDAADAWDRVTDSELKILSEISEKLNGINAKGKITLFTELAPCESCSGIILQFLEKYPNITIEVIHNENKLIIP